ncbi:aminotransferase-like domain-containing protein [Mangrovitalea sediminis]|uniref:aminotransferase-like domain-containing protein n=1 Tax=Mangrovitalea sediminis TaxID=1982043 RepID=UPI000BE588A2|nr:PLP-dependent aminotransferase family protein [Mangrovitalea sediminis]
MSVDEEMLAALVACYQQQPESLGKQVRIEQALRIAIRDFWPVGQRLPSHRVLCERMGVARNTLAQAVRCLIAEGWLVTGQGQGTWAQRPPESPPVESAEPVRLSDRAQAVLGKRGVSRVQSGAFMPGIPDITHFPMRKWRQLYTSVTVPHNALLLSYSSGGYGPLKRAIRDFLWRWRGIRCDSEQIIITEGAHQGIQLCAMALADVGDRVLLDSPCYWGARNIFTAFGLDVEMLPWRPASGYDLRQTDAPVRLAYFTGARQYPLNVPTNIDDKRSLCASAKPDFVIEDDYEFGSDHRENLIFDAGRPDRLMVGSFSKLMFPGLRLGYLVVPQALAAPLSRFRSEVSREGRMMDQAVLAQFIADGDLDAWYKRIRGEYLGRQQVLHDRLAGLPGVIRISPPSNAIGLCAELAPHIDDRALAQRLLREQLVVQPLSPVCAEGDDRRGLILGIGMVSGYALIREADRLRALLKQWLPTF